MSFIISPQDAVANILIDTHAFEAITASAGVSVGDSITRRQVLDKDGAVTSTSYFNETTGLVVSTAPAAANLVSIVDNSVDILERDLTKKVTQTPVLQVGTSSGIVGTQAAGSISSLYVVNANGATVGHWVGVVAGSTAPVSGTSVMFAATWIPGAANSQALLDSSYFNSFPSTTGFTIVRSSQPNIYTVLGAALANNQTVRFTSVVN
jgi:hypothetical protein